MLQILAAVSVVGAVLVLVASALSRTDRARRDGAVAIWLGLHHVTVLLIAVSAVVAFATPPDAYGTSHPSDPFGGYVGRYALLATIWTVLALPLTAAARSLTGRVAPGPPRTTVVVVAWLLLVTTGILLAAMMFLS